MTACRPYILFQSETLDIQHCPDCGLMHISLGTITLKMSEQQFMRFAKDMGQGLADFILTQHTPSSPGTRLM